MQQFALRRIVRFFGRERKRNKQRRQTVAARQKKDGGGGDKRETKVEDNRNSWNSCKRDRPGGEHGRATKKTRVATRRTHTSVSFTRSVLSLFTYARTIGARVKHTNDSFSSCENIVRAAMQMRDVWVRRTVFSTVLSERNSRDL